MNTKIEKIVKINKDLVDASLMLSVISLVLIGTSEFSNATHKTAIMIILAILSVALLVCRILASRQS
ncbi:MAG: hypothetical protein LBL42_04830 [Tannerella sp.]|jgi:hypothetical protein|nr:hypothetical protein [Tannerella sp.]